MAEDSDLYHETGPTERRGLTGWRKWALATLLAVIGLVSLAVFTLNSPIGHRFIANEIAKMAPASGLRVRIGRIEGDLYGKARLHDVVLLDRKGPFLRVPLVDLNWRPLNWLSMGLDVRALVTHRGTLYRVPELEPGDPDAPILPDFDIRVDRFRIEGLTLAEGVVDGQRHRVDLSSRIDIRKGRALVKASGKLGYRDSFRVLLDAEPDGNRFDLGLDYNAPRGGVIAGLVDARAGYRARVDGDGTWNDWKGGLYVTRNGARFAAFRLTNKAGRYGFLGQAKPAQALSGVMARLAGETVSLKADATLESSILDGEFILRGAGLDANGRGKVDLAGKVFDSLSLHARLRQAKALTPDMAIEGARLSATLDGPFRDLGIKHKLAIARIAAGETRIDGLVQQGEAVYDGSRLLIPLDVQIARVTTGNDWIDPRLAKGRLVGDLALSGKNLSSQMLALTFPGTIAKLTLKGDLSSTAFRLAGPVSATGLTLNDVGTVDGTARIALLLGGSKPWKLDANVTGRVSKVSNATIANLAGPQIRFNGLVGSAAATPLSFRRFNLGSDKLTLQLDGRVTSGSTTLRGKGRQADYGPFTVEGSMDKRGPRAVLVFADPLPAAGLSDVKVALEPEGDGFRIETEGGSLLGPFSGKLGLVAPAGGPTRIAVEQFSIWKTNVTGGLLLDKGTARGELALSGGGIDGTVNLVPRGGGQGFDARIRANGARFAGPTPLTIAQAKVDIMGTYASGSSTISGSGVAEGVSYGQIFLGRLAGKAELTNGSGKIVGSVSGQRGSRFNLNFDSNVAPAHVALALRGEFAGKPISMPRRAVLSKDEGGGWTLAPTQLSYGDGHALVSGHFGDQAGNRLELKLDRMPVSLADLMIADLGMGGTASGVIDFRTGPDGVPTGNSRLMVKGLSRSGLVLTSRPIDVALALDLGREEMRLRAALDEAGKRLGRAQMRVSGLPQQGPLAERLRAGRLEAQMRYNGSAASLWRLAALDIIDLTGSLQVTADATGTLADPRISGGVASDDLRIQSAISGTDVSKVKLRGRFDGPRLAITTMTGTTPNGGTVTGSGFFDLTNIGAADEASGVVRGPRFDIKAAATNARLIGAHGLSATISGPLRIVSSGIGGTIAGRVRIDRASWRLGTAAEVRQIPQVKVREINSPANIAPARAAGPPWRYLIDAKSPSRIDVDGMGLDSEWGADVKLRGTVENPRIGGQANLVRGSYSFAGSRFEMTRGRISFDVDQPIDPRLDIRAQTKTDSLEVEVSVTGHSLQPEIAFTSNPSLPEDEILSRLLFGSSITDISATDALQLGAAVASLRGGGGGGIDPINQLRTAIGLDRLRIVSADPALDRGTGVALGKNIGHRFYVELVTDGRAYSATQVEFRVTSWLSLLGSVSTIGRNSLVAEVSKDY